MPPLTPDKNIPEIEVEKALLVGSRIGHNDHFGVYVQFKTCHAEGASLDY